MLKKMLGDEELTGDAGELTGTLDHFSNLQKRLDKVAERRKLIGDSADLRLEEEVVRNEIARVRLTLEGELQEKKLLLRKLSRNKRGS